MKTVTVQVKGLNFAGCGREIEKRLGQLAPILAVEASYVTQTATITYDDTQMTEAQLRKLVEDCGFACGEPLSLATRLSTTGVHGPHAAGAVHAGQIAPAVQMETQEAVEPGPAAAGHAMADMGREGHDQGVTVFWAPSAQQECNRLGEWQARVGVH
jgi:P-type Cu2+ transporter